MISKARKHAQDFINRSDWSKPWMTMILHTDKDGAYELVNPHMDSYYNVTGIYFIRIYLEDKVTRIGKWHMLYVGASWGDKTSTSPRPPENNKSSLKNSLARNKQKIQKVLSKEMKTKYVPSITFELDNSFDDIDRINKIIGTINEN